MCVCVCWCVAVKNKERRLNVESSRLRLSLPLFLQQCVSLCLCIHTQYMCECVSLCRHAESSCTIMNVLCEPKGRVVLNTPAWHPPQQQQLRHVVWRQFNDSRTLLTLPPKTSSAWHFEPTSEHTWKIPTMKSISYVKQCDVITQYSSSVPQITMNKQELNEITAERVWLGLMFYVAIKLLISDFEIQFSETTANSVKEPEMNHYQRIIKITFRSL